MRKGAAITADMGYVSTVFNTESVMYNNHTNFQSQWKSNKMNVCGYTFVSVVYAQNMSYVAFNIYPISAIVETHLDPQN